MWFGLGVALVVPIFMAAGSPLLQWRDPVYWIASFSGIAGLALMLVQPLLASGLLPGLTQANNRRTHRALGLMLVLAVLVHVGALWITSPPDVVDALLFVSPTPFSVWGVLAMWAVFGAGLLVALRKVLRMKYPAWHRLHIALVAIAVTGTIVHALRIEGLLEMNSKIALSVLVAGALMIGVVRNERKRLAVRRRSHLPG